MAGCKAQYFSAIDAAAFAAMQARGAEAGVPIRGNDGQASSLGVTLRWHYDPDAQALTVECMEAPFFIPCSTIAAKVQELVDSCRAQSV